MGFNEVLSSWSSSEEEDGHEHDEDRDQVISIHYYIEPLHIIRPQHQGH